MSSDGRTASDGIRYNPNLCTASVWDNKESGIETLDGKAILLAIIGHTYQNIGFDKHQPNTERWPYLSCRNKKKIYL